MPNRETLKFLDAMEVEARQVGRAYTLHLDTTQAGKVVVTVPKVQFERLARQIAGLVPSE